MVTGVCNRDKSFDQAVQICADAGARLCTQDELLNDCTRGKSLLCHCLLLICLMRHCTLIHYYMFVM